MMEMEVAVENNNMRSLRGRVGSIDGDTSRENVAEKTMDMSKDRDFQYKPPQICKVALVGDSTVGKTTACEIFCKPNSNYGPNYYMTCGVEIYGKSIKIPNTSISDERVNLIVVDSSGKDIYAEFLPKYWDKLDFVVLMVDLTSPTSLENGLTWLELAKGSLSIPNAQTTATDKDGSTIGVLIGNKIDLTEQRVLSSDAVRHFANEHRLEYFECSAKQNIGLEEPFLYLAQQWTARGESKGGTVKVNEESRRRKK